MTFINIKTQVGDDKNVLLYGISLSLFLSLSLSLNLYVLPGIPSWVMLSSKVN